MGFITSDIKKKPLPEKRPGRHRFIAIASFTVSEEAARKAEMREAPAILDQENLWDISVGCIDCESPWEPNMKKFCNAPAYQG